MNERVANRVKDDEYAQLSGVVDPRILVTTSRDPSSRLATFSKGWMPIQTAPKAYTDFISTEIRLLLPTSVRLNRGNSMLLPLHTHRFHLLTYML
jgi:U3 small nucleolar ribonucleoprotein protein IMP4